MQEEPVKRGVGRPRKTDSERVVYQRVPILYETYKKLQRIASDQGVTYTQLIEAMAQQNNLW